MSPAQFQAKREEGMSPPPLKINKASHCIKKSPPSSFSFSSSSPSFTSTSSIANGVSRPPQRQPVIIYTHSPKVIRTNPRDFMALVQKLTGRSRFDEENLNLPAASKPTAQRENKRVMISRGRGDDDESSSVVIEENWHSLGNNDSVNSHMTQQTLESQSDYANNIPVFSSNLGDFLCLNQTYYNCSNSMSFISFNARNSSTYDGLNTNQL